MKQSKPHRLILENKMNDTANENGINSIIDAARVLYGSTVTCGKHNSRFLDFIEHLKICFNIKIALICQ